MKILAKDLKKETKIKAETIDDLWNLSKIISKGDIVGTKTVRTVETTDKKEKPTDKTKKPAGKAKKANKK